MAIAIITIFLTAKYAKKQVVAAFGQLEEAKATREEQAQPNVVLFGDTDKRDWRAYEIVIKNYGSTPAFDVKVDFPEPLAISPSYGTTATDYIVFPEPIPILAPGQEWRTMWDYAIRRNDTIGLEDRHDGIVKYRDSKGKHFESKAILDWSTLKDTVKLETKGVHDIAKTLSENLPKVVKAVEGVRQELDSMGTEHGGVWMYTDSAEPERERRDDVRKQREDRSRRNLEHLRSLRPSNPTADQTTAPLQPETPSAEPSPEPEA